MVIASRDRPDMLRDALAATIRAIRAGDELVVVDSASLTGETVEVAEHAGVRAVRCDLPGLARARNAGVAATSAPLVAFTDDDCRPRPDWVDAVRRGFDAPDVGFVAGQVLADEATAGFAVSVTDTTQPRTFVRGDDPATIGHGANFSARRVALDAIGGFDESLGAGGRFRAGEDYDFFHRALCAGWTGRFEPSSVVGHRQWRSRRDAVRLQWGYGLGAGAFAVKAVKLSPAEGLPVLVGQLWSHGVVPLGRDVRQRYKTGMAMGALRLAGTVTGCVCAAPLPVRDGRFST